MGWQDRVTRDLDERAAQIATEAAARPAPAHAPHSPARYIPCYVPEPMAPEDILQRSRLQQIELDALRKSDINGGQLKHHRRRNFSPSKLEMALEEERRGGLGRKASGWSSDAPVEHPPTTIEAPPDNDRIARLRAQLAQTNNEMEGLTTSPELTPERSFEDPQQALFDAIASGDVQTMAAAEKAIKARSRTPAASPEQVEAQQISSWQDALLGADYVRVREPEEPAPVDWQGRVLKGDSGSKSVHAGREFCQSKAAMMRDQAFSTMKSAVCSLSTDGGKPNADQQLSMRARVNQLSNRGADEAGAWQKEMLEGGMKPTDLMEQLGGMSVEQLSSLQEAQELKASSAVMQRVLAKLPVSALVTLNAIN